MWSYSQSTMTSSSKCESTDGRLADWSIMDSSPHFLMSYRKKILKHYYRNVMNIVYGASTYEWRIMHGSFTSGIILKSCHAHWGVVDYDSNYDNVQRFWTFYEWKWRYINSNYYYYYYHFYYYYYYVEERNCKKWPERCGHVVAEI